MSSTPQQRKALGAVCSAWIHSSFPWAWAPATMATHCRSAHCCPSLLPVLLWSDPLHRQPFKGLSPVLFCICSFFLLFLFFPILIFLVLSFCLLSFILHACWFSHLLPSAQLSFPFSLCISSDPQAIYLIASPFSSSMGSFHLLVQFVSKQQMSIRFVPPACCLSQIIWRRKRDAETVVLTSKLTHHMLWFPFVSSSVQGTFSSV